ncbi:hypothetical protein HC891_22580 [Candidatus Gracilibacteria bacterium]|nr:hypothetical protein [Candidatus Gracilibacteria bacterium]
MHKITGCPICRSSDEGWCHRNGIKQLLALQIEVWFKLRHKTRGFVGRNGHEQVDIARGPWFTIGGTGEGTANAVENM